MSVDKILALDFSGPLASVALFSKEGNILGEIIETHEKSHVSRCTKIVDDLLLQCACRWSDLTGISLNVGPGSYTGLRVSTVLAKAYSLSHGLGLYSQMGHTIIAYHLRADLKEMHILLDANKEVVYHAKLNSSGSLTPVLRKKISELHLLPSDHIYVNTDQYHTQFADLYSISPNLTYFPLTAKLQAAAFQHPDLISHVDPLTLRPFYLNQPNITQRKKPLIA